MNRINFCAKIPVATCSIIEKRTQTPVRATIYEHDAKDSEDVQYFKNLSRGWKYGKEVAENIDMKHEYQYIYENDRYFSIESQEGKPIGLMQVNDNSDFIDVEYLESYGRKKFSNIGTCLLAYAGIETIKKGQERLIISEAVKKAKPFYIEHCGFRPFDKILEMPKSEIGAYNKRYAINSIYRNVGVYTIEDKSGKTICICDTMNDEDEIRVKHIESSQDKKYKYAGSNMLKMLGVKVLDSGKNFLTINDAQEEALRFYIQKCGFDILGVNIDDDSGLDLTMGREDLANFTRRFT